MPRNKFLGVIALLFSISLCLLFIYFAFINDSNIDLKTLNFSISYSSFYTISVPIGLVFLGFLGTGFWIGWSILTIKVEPPMPDIVEKKDYAKLKAVILCIITIALASLFIYGIYIKSYWALAIPATAITLVILGMIFWVGIAIITTRATLPESKNK